MRVRNGEEFLARAVLSHLEFFDEIVIVYNQCTDGTEAIATRLADRYPEKIKAYHYLDRVYPPGHHAYADLPQDSPSSIGTYYNFSLTRTTRRVVTKLDDDHICIRRNFAPIVNRIRQSGYRLGGKMLCFSGINLVRGESGYEILESEAFCGTGDHGFFEVTENTFFTHGPKHEIFSRRGVRRVYTSLVYLHCKFLKESFGFHNYELSDNPDGRYQRKLQRFLKSRRGVELEAFVRRYRHLGRFGRIASLLSEKPGIILGRAVNLARDLGDVDLDDVMEQAAALERGL